MKQIASAWAPTHATLFFAVPERKENYLEMGSIGGGVNFETGMTTKVTVSDRTEVTFNGQPIDGKVTKTVIEEFRIRTGIEETFAVAHQSEFPIGHGLSTSGAGAIGTALALNELGNSDLTYIDLLQIAHIADAKNHTGLGSVLGQSVAGIELRITQGAPGKAIVKSFEEENELIIVPIAPLSTSDVLTSEKQMKTVTKAGIMAVDELKKRERVTLTQLINVGKRFMRTCGLLTKRVQNLINSLERIGETYATMAMIGETLVILPQDPNQVAEWADENNLKYHVTELSRRIPHLI